MLASYDQVNFQYVLQVEMAVIITISYDVGFTEYRNAYVRWSNPVKSIMLL